MLFLVRTLHCSQVSGCLVNGQQLRSASTACAEFGNEVWPGFVPMTTQEMHGSIELSCGQADIHIVVL